MTARSRASGFCGSSRCGPDCNQNGSSDWLDIADGDSQDCNGNRIPDACDFESGRSQDCNGNGIPDDCDPDCDGDGTPDECELASGDSQDCNQNGVPDECDLVPLGFGLEETEVLSTGDKPVHVTSADLDGDGDRDLVVTNERSDSLSLLTNLGNGSSRHVLCEFS